MPSFPKLPKNHVYIGTGDDLDLSDRFEGYSSGGPEHLTHVGTEWRYGKQWSGCHMNVHYCVHKDHPLAKTHGHPPPPWDEAPEGTTHRVQEAMGKWFWLLNATQDPEAQPVRIWSHKGNGCWQHCKYNTGPNPAWRETMERKPKTLLDAVHELKGDLRNLNSTLKDHDGYIHLWYTDENRLMIAHYDSNAVHEGRSVGTVDEFRQLAIQEGYVPDLPEPPAGSRVLGLGGPKLEAAYPEGFKGYMYDKGQKTWMESDTMWNGTLTTQYYAIIEDDTMNKKLLSQYNFPLFDITDEEALFLRKADYSQGLCAQAYGRDELKRKISEALDGDSYIVGYMRKQGVHRSVNGVDIRTEWVRQLLERHEGALPADYIGPAIYDPTGAPTMLHPMSPKGLRSETRRMTPAEWAHYVEGKPLLKRGQLIAVRDFNDEPWRIHRFLGFEENNITVKTFLALDTSSSNIIWNQWRHLTEEEWTKLREGEE